MFHDNNSKGRYACRVGVVWYVAALKELPPRGSSLSTEPGFPKRATLGLIPRTGKTVVSRHNSEKTEGHFLVVSTSRPLIPPTPPAPQPQLCATCRTAVVHPWRYCSAKLLQETAKMTRWVQASEADKMMSLVHSPPLRNPPKRTYVQSSL